MVEQKLHPNFGLALSASFDEVMANRTDVRAMLYKNKMLAIRGLGELTTDQLWDLHTCFGYPWSRKDYAASIKETLSSQTRNKDVPYFGTDIYNKNIKANTLSWHRDIPWHREIRYPIRSLYAHDTYETPTHFADCDVLCRTQEEIKELLDVEILIQYWYYRQYDSLNRRQLLTKYVPLVEVHPATGQFTVLLNTFGLEEARDEKKTFKFMTSFNGSWILGARRRGQVMDNEMYLKFMNGLHERVCTPDNIVTWTYQKHDLVLFDNTSGVFHSRDLVSPSDGKRSFYRMNVRHSWQTEPAVDL